MSAVSGGHRPPLHEKQTARFRGLETGGRRILRRLLFGRRRRRGLAGTGLLETLAELIRQRLEAGRGGRRRLDVIIHLRRFRHRLAAGRQPGVVNAGSQLRHQRVDGRHVRKQIHVRAKFRHVETFRENVGIALGGLQGVFHEGQTVRAGLVEALAFILREREEEGQFLLDGGDGGFDGGHGGVRDLRGDILIGHIFMLVEVNYKKLLPKAKNRFHPEMEKYF